MGPLFEPPSRPLLKLGLRPLARYGAHQETISRRPEQIDVTPSDTRLKSPEKGPSFGLDSNKRQGGGKMRSLFKSPPGPLLKSGLGHLFRCGTHQTVSGRLEQVYLPSDPSLEWPGEGPLFELNLNEYRGPKCGHHFESPPGPLFMSGLGALGQIWHQLLLLLLLSYVAEYVY